MKSDINSLVVLAHGEPVQHLRAVLAITSFYANLSDPRAQVRTLLFTDHPAFFHDYLRGLPVDYHFLDRDDMRELRGEIDFLHRVKIAVIERAFATTSGTIMFVDSDTFFVADPAPVFVAADPDHAFMHRPEYPFDSEFVEGLSADHPIKLFRDLITDAVFLLADGRTIEVSPDCYSWNAGAMVFHPSHARFLPDVYELTSHFYSATHCHTAEQYAFSVLLQNNLRLEGCDNIVHHYWDGVKKDIADVYLHRRVLGLWNHIDLHRRLAAARSLTVALRQAFHHHALAHKHEARRHLRAGEMRPALTHGMRAILKDPRDVEFVGEMLSYRRSFLDAALAKARRMIVPAG